MICIIDGLASLYVFLMVQSTKFKNVVVGKEQKLWFKIYTFFIFKKNFYKKISLKNPPNL